MTSYKSVRDVLYESVVVGIGLIFLFILILILIGFIPYFNISHKHVDFNKRHLIHMGLATFLSGAFFHLLCEYSGVNVWYVKQYKELIPKE